MSKRLLLLACLANLIITTQTETHCGGWTASSPVWMTSQDSLNPSITIDSLGAEHAAWHERSVGNYNQIFYSRNSGSGYTSPVIISQGGSQHCYTPILRADGTMLHASWTRQEPGEDRFEIYYRRNTGGGWEAFINASNTDIKSIRQSMAVRGSIGPIVCWDEALYGPDNYEILLAEWTGSGFGPAVNVSQTPGGTVYGSVRSNVAICPNTDVWVVWPDRISGNYRINARRRTGGVWQPRQEISSLQVGPHKPGLACGPNNEVHVVYGSDALGSYFLYYQKWNGSYWTTPELIPNQPGPQMLRPAVAVDDDGVVHIVGDNSYQGSGEIYHITNTNGVWSAWTNISRTTGTDSLYADLAFGADTLTAVWQDNSDGAGGKGVYQVYHTKMSYASSPQPVRSAAVYASDRMLRIQWANPTDLPLWGTMVRCKMSGYPTGPTDGQLVCDKPAAPGAEDSFNHDGLINGQTYYYAVFTHDNRGRYSSPVYVQGTPQSLSCLQAKQYEDGTPVDLKGKVVSAKLSDENCIYVQDLDRCSGIRIVTQGTGLAVGDKVDVAGIVRTRVINNVPAERQIENATIVKTGVFPAKPMFVQCRSVGGSAPSGLARGVKNSVGLHNMGLLVTIAGNVTDVKGNYIYVDDGSNVENIYGLSTPEIGVMVKCPAAPSVQKGNLVQVTGVIVGSVPLGWTENRAFIQLRTMTDLQVVAAQ